MAMMCGFIEDFAESAAWHGSCKEREAWLELATSLVRANTKKEVQTSFHGARTVNRAKTTSSPGNSEKKGGMLIRSQQTKEIDKAPRR
jgi:hypothetical protein